MLNSRHPLWLCGFRPFFLLTALSGGILIVLWLGALAHGWPLPAVAGGALVWHGHEMIFGFALAAVAGFALTAVPEFTATQALSAGPVRLLVGLWLLGRAAFWCSGVFGTSALIVAGLAHLGLLGGLVWLLAPRFRGMAGQRHRSFLWALLALAFTVVGFYADASAGENPLRWLHAALGLLMILIVIALSRISMRIVNTAIEADPAADAGRNGYLARPPRRNLAIMTIAAHTLAEFVAPASPVGGWLACAAAAALCHLQSDWHVGRPLLTRWPLMLFGVYLLMAAGYALIGIGTLGGHPVTGSGRHLLAAGAMGLNIFVVLNIAGRIHCGLPLENHPWVPIGATLIAVGALLRAVAGLPGLASQPLFVIAGLCWSLPFMIYAVRMGVVFLAPRHDGGDGCSGPTVTRRHGPGDPQNRLSTS